MPRKLYGLDSTISHPKCYAMIKDTSYHEELSMFFKSQLVDELKVNSNNMEFIADKGYTPKNIEKEDYIFSFSALLFSKRFVDRIGGFLKEEMQFFPCKLICRDNAFDWYAAKITHRFPVINKELSYRNLPNGKRKLEIIKYRNDIEEQFFISIDSDEITYVVVTEFFKTLCEENGLKIEFRELN